MPTGVYQHKPHQVFQVGHTTSQETRQKISKAHKGKKFSDEHKRKIGEASKGNKYCLGKKLTKAHKNKISKANKGKKKPPRTEEHKKRLGEANKGRSAWNKGTKGLIKAWNKGTKGLQVAWNKGKENPRWRASNNPRWKGGITSLNEQVRHSFKYRQWRSDCFTRDDFTCQRCGERGVILSVDHYPKTFSAIMEEYKIKILEEALNCEEMWNINNGMTVCWNSKCHPRKHKTKQI